MKGSKELSVFLECSTNSTPTMKTLKRYIDLVSAFGYTHMYLGLTDAYKMEGEPYFNFCRGGYDVKQLQEIDAYAEERGIELRVNIQVLGHLHYLRRHGCYDSLFDTFDSLMVGKDEVYEFVDKMLATMSKAVKSRTIHIGMDEIYDLGLGRYLNHHEYADRKTLFMEHLYRVVKLAEKYDYTCEIWADMLFYMAKGSFYGNDDAVVPKELKECLPKNVRIVHWYYGKQSDEVLAGQIKMLQEISGDISFAGAAGKSFGMAPANKTSIGIIEHQMKVCKQMGVQHYMVTVWSDAGAHCSDFAVLPTLFAAAEIAGGKRARDVDKARFYEIVGAEYDDFILLDRLNNPFDKELLSKNARCYWGFYSDIFLGSYDMLLDSKSNEAYAALVPQYEAIQGGDYQMMFDNYSLYAKVLSIKMNLGVMIREAYRNKDKQLLHKYATEDIPKMMAYMKDFAKHYDEWWLSENMAFGLEVHHLYNGGQLERWQYVANRILRHLEDGQPIEELEREYLPPSTVGTVTEDNCFELDKRRLISYCGL